MSPPAVRPLIGERLEELLALMQGADSAELKVTIPDAGRRSAVAALEMDPLQAQIRQVFFFDTPDLALDAAGVVVRARRVQGRDDDTVVKLRPVVPGALPPEQRRSPGFVVEVDAMPGGFVCSASFKGTARAGRVQEVVAGERPLRKLFSKEQRAFFAAHAPDGVALDALSVLGPINVLKLKFAPAGLDRKVVAELWLYPDGSRILELSTKCAPAEALGVAVQTRAFLTDRGVDLGGRQQTKTRAALRFFARELSADPA
jgi:hypothetical protein